MKLNFKKNEIWKKVLRRGGYHLIIFSKKSKNEITFSQAKICEIFLGAPLPNPQENLFPRLLSWLYIKAFSPPKYFEKFPEGFALGHLKIDSKKSYHQAYKRVMKLNFKKIEIWKKVLKKGRGYYLITLSIFWKLA